MTAASPESALDTSGVEPDPIAEPSPIIQGSAEPFPDPMETQPENEAEEGESLLGSDTETAPVKGTEETDSEPPEAEAKAKAGEVDYSDLKVPDTFDASDSGLAQFKDQAAKAGLSFEQAQAFLDADIARAEENTKAYQARVEKQNNEWAEEAKSDPEIGGVDFEENLHKARKFLANYNDPKLVEMLNKTGMGNHPSFIKMFVRLGQVGSEDSTSVLMQPGRRERTLEERLVPELAD